MNDFLDTMQNRISGFDTFKKAYDAAKTSPTPRPAPTNIDEDELTRLAGLFKAAGGKWAFTDGKQKILEYVKITDPALATTLKENAPGDRYLTYLGHLGRLLSAGQSLPREISAPGSAVASDGSLDSLPAELRARVINFAKGIKDHMREVDPDKPGIAARQAHSGMMGSPEAHALNADLEKHGSSLQGALAEARGK